MASVTVQTGDIIEWKISQWEKTLADESIWDIEPAARIEQLAASLAEHMDQIAIAYGLANQGDYQVLALLRLAHHRGHAVTSTDIARRLGMTAATMVGRIDRLEKRDYVQRVRHPTDRRAFNLVITQDGIVSAERMVLARTEDRKRLLEALTDDERATLTTLLRKLVAFWA